MRRKALPTFALALAAGLAVLAAPSDAAERPKVIVLGFDGVSADLAARWMEAGHLPNLQRLAQQGSFGPLVPANPPLSPVSWGVLETGSNPGKSNLPDFVRRVLPEDPLRPGAAPMPQPVGTSNSMVPTGELAEHLPLSGTEKLLVSLSGAKGYAVLAAAALVLALLVVLIARGILRLPLLAVAMPLGLLFGGALAYLGHARIAALPAKFPAYSADIRGVPFWDVLDENDVRFVGVQVPCVFPTLKQYRHARILGGLFTPDVAGGTGSWFIYTNDEWSTDDVSTEAGGRMYKLYADPDGVVRTKLRGPYDFVREQEFEERVAALDAQLKREGLGAEEKADLQEALASARSARQTFNTFEKRITVPMEIRTDYAARKARIQLGGNEQELAEGGWSDYFAVTFPIARGLSVNALARVYLQECRLDDGGMERLRLFVPPVAMSPTEPPFWLPISSPPGYAGELAADIGLYDTVGWACYTNPVKADELPEQAFMEGIEHTFERRTAQLFRELDRDDWDTLFHVESTTDRVGHMTYAYMDPAHPQYAHKARNGEPLREQDIRAFGRTFPLKDSLLELYKEMDRVVGDVMQRIEQGRYGKDCTLMIVSDHGFQPYRYGLNVNVWLHRNGFLCVGDGETCKDFKVGEIQPPVAKVGRPEFLGYVCWKHSVAYAMGLGKIFISRKTADWPQGIVEGEEQYQAVKRQIMERLEQFVDPVEGHGGGHVVSKAYDGDEVYFGPYKEGTGDIIAGFNAGYRVSWGNTTGDWEGSGAEAFGLIENDNPWGGDHGADPEVVKGILFSNRRLRAEQGEANLVNIAPTILKLYGLAQPAEWDGRPLLVE